MSFVTVDYVEVEDVFPQVKPTKKHGSSAYDNLLYSATVVAAGSATVGVKAGDKVIFAKLFTYIEGDSTRYFTHKNAVISVE